MRGPLLAAYDNVIVKAFSDLPWRCACVTQGEDVDLSKATCKLFVHNTTQKDVTS